jgi:hypothetical protein
MTHIKILGASQSLIHQFENLKRKLYNCNASIYFNKKCLNKRLTPSYAQIKIPNTSPAHKYTQQKVPKLRIKDKIKFLHCKNQKLNSEIYQSHLKLANLWGNMWPHIQQNIEDKLQKECRTRYNSLDNKIKCLTQQQTNTHLPKNQFYPRVVNMTDISFSEPEMALLQKAPNTIYTINLETGSKPWRSKPRQPSHASPLQNETYTEK